MGYAHSAEVWQKNELVGGLYGIRIGKVFCGESMFSRVSNASKFGFIQYVQELKKIGVELIDCQVYSDHLASLGARMISRSSFMEFL
jgi:leucyl/phenylalanyl-tRNA--protein transferase